MKGILIFFIHSYWYLIPEEKRRCCIFSVSCSNHVLHKLHAEGFFSAIKAFIFRFNNCRKGYQLKMVDERIVLYTINNIKVNEENIRPSLLSTFINNNNLNKNLDFITEKSVRND